MGSKSSTSVRSASNNTDREVIQKKVSKNRASVSSPSISTTSRGKDNRSRSSDAFWSRYLQNMDERVLLMKEVALSTRNLEDSPVGLENVALDYKNPLDIDPPTDSAGKFYKKMLLITNLGRALVFVKRRSLSMREEQEFELQFELELNDVEKIRFISDQVLEIDGSRTIFIGCKERAVLMKVWKLIHNGMTAKPKVVSPKSDHKMFDKFILQKRQNTKKKNQAPPVPQSNRLINGLPDRCILKTPEEGALHTKRRTSLQTRSSSNYSKLLARSTQMRKNMTRTDEK